MPLGPQPKRARGTIGHPYSALNLRLLFAALGLVLCAGLGIVLAWSGYPVAGLVLGVLAVIAAVDLVVILIRRRRRQQAEPWRHSLFE